MTKSTNYNLNLPAASDNVDVSKLTENFSAIDTALKAVSDIADGAIPASGGTATGNIGVGKSVETDDNNGVYINKDGRITVRGNETSPALRFHKNSEYYTQIVPASVDENVTLNAPSRSGTLALTTPASTSENGLMSSSDKSKMDGIAAGATKVSVGKLTIDITVGANANVSSSTGTYYGTATVPAGATVRVMSCVSQNGQVVPTAWTESVTGTTFKVVVGGRNNSSSSISTKMVVPYIVIV